MSLKLLETRTKVRITRSLVTGILSILSFPTIWAQSSIEPSPSYFPNTVTGAEAKSRSELDAFGLVMEAGQPSAVITAAETFATQYPRSQLLLIVYLREMQAEIDANSFDGAIGVGHRVLRVHPDNLQALVLMAQVLSDVPTNKADKRGVFFAEARADVTKARSLLETFHLPEGTSAGEFLRNKQLLRASLEESSGTLDLDEGNYGDAIKQYQSALAIAGAVSPQLSFRLGLCYFNTGQIDKAKLYLQQAIGIDHGVIGTRAAELLKQIAK